MYIVGGVVIVVVIAGILLSYSGILPSSFVQTSTPTRPAGAEEAVTVPAETQTEASIELVNYPSTAGTNSPFTISWKINSNKEVEIPHTAAHYDTKLVASPTAATDYASAGRYLSGKVPGTFSDSITIQGAGTYYFRAHAIVEGKDIWTDEKTLIVTAPSAQTNVREILLTADDDNFYLNNDPITTLSASLGEKIKIKFKTLTSNVAFGGLRYKSSDFGGIDTGSVAPGAEKDVQITVGANGAIRSYWPNTDRLKGTLSIIIA